MNRSHRLLLSTITLALCAASHAASPPASEARPAVLKALEARGVASLREFKTGSDLRGFAGALGQDPVTVYVTRDGNAIVGTRIDAQGRPLDAGAIDELVSKPVSEATWRRLEASGWIRDGLAAAPRTVYVFTDANCPWCHRFWHAARPWVDGGKVQLRQIFVGVIRADSEAKAAAILGSPDPAQALARNERDFDKGGIAPAKAIAPDIKRKLQANLQLMNELGIRGTPGIAFLDADGRLKIVGGFPQGEQLGEVMGPR